MIVENVIAAIEEQQAGLKKFDSVFCVGEQLKEIVRSEGDGAATLVAQDLSKNGMKLGDCEKKIAAFASAHRIGNCGCCPPNEAERIIREFYGIQTEVNSGKLGNPIQTSKTISLFDLI